MATPDTVPILTRITVPLGRGEFDDRKFYGLPGYVRWITETVPQLTAGRLNAPLTPQEQIDDILHRWNARKPMRYRRGLSDMDPTTSGVWELKSADLRIFGWLYRPRIFIAAFGGYADDYKLQNGKPAKESYDDAVARVVWIRDRLDLDPPKFVDGVYDALV